MANVQLDDDHATTAATKAFLVVRRGGRWTDLLRLSPDRTAIIGRASSNQIIIRSHQASRQHAEIRWQDGKWWVRDLASRNGTMVDGSSVAVAQVLVDGSRIEVAGCVMTFVTKLNDAFAAGQSTLDSISSQSAQAEHSADQLTLDGLAADGLANDPASIGGEEIVHRSLSSRYLPTMQSINSKSDSGSSSTSMSGTLASEAWQHLFALAYRLATADSIAQAAQQALATLAAAVPRSAGGVYLPTTANPSTLVAFINHDNRSYRPPAAKLVQAATLQGAIVVRNLVDDDELQDADSRGEYSMTSTIVAPISLQPIDQTGYLHLYTTDPVTTYTSIELELVIAVAGVLAAAIENLATRGQLTRSLRHSRSQVKQLREQLQGSIEIVGNSTQTRELKSLIAKVAPSDATVLVRGESGVGKELVTAAIHHASPRRDQPLVCLNCAALAPTLLESELFGHEKGAFTGATEQKKGKFEAAQGGTLMLDEIGEMHIDLQAKLLRVLEGHAFERLGGQVPIRADVRLIAATNRDLAAEVQRGRFRGDLFYRLNVIEIVVPPLRTRTDDILVIAEHYLAHFSERCGRVIDGFTRSAAAALVAHDWPGNIRELKNVIERAVVLGSGDTIDAGDLSIAAASHDHKQTFTPETITTSDPADAQAELLSLDEIEKRHLVHVLQQVAGNKSRAAMILGIERSTLDRKLKRFAITVSRD